MRNRLLLLSAFLSLCLGPSSLHAQASSLPPEAPANLRPPAGQSLLLQLQGKGNQIYTCSKTAEAYAWQLKAPEATLIDQDGKVAGRHFAGPTWQLKDGSTATGKMLASAPSPDKQSIPWLLVNVTAHSGSDGLLSGVQSIQRLHTAGGSPPPAACGEQNLNQQQPVPYQATYYFYGTSR